MHDPNTAASPETTLFVQLERSWIEAKDIRPALELLAPLIADAEAVRRHAGAVRLMFDGWDDDPRELWDIAQVREWFLKLTAAYPYWFVLSDRRGSALAVILNVLVGPGIAEPGVAGGPPMRRHARGAISETMRVLFMGMNTLCDRFGIPAATNSAWTREVVQALDRVTAIA